MPRKAAPSNEVQYPPKVEYRRKPKEKLDVYIYRLIVKQGEASKQKLGLSKGSMRVLNSMTFHIYRKIIAKVAKLMNLEEYKTVTTDVVGTAIKLTYPDTLYPYAFDFIGKTLKQSEK